jgi:hypothetical protein
MFKNMGQNWTDPLQSAKNQQSAKFSTNQSILSNRDVLICLLLKLGVNLLSHNIAKTKPLSNISNITSSIINTDNDIKSHLDSYYDDIFTQQMYLEELWLENEQLDSELDQYTMFELQDEFDEFSIEENRYKDSIKSSFKTQLSLHLQKPQQHDIITTNTRTTTTSPAENSQKNDNSVQMKLLNNLSDEFLENYIECIALCSK